MRPAYILIIMDVAMNYPFPPITGSDYGLTAICLVYLLGEVQFLVALHVRV